MDSLTQLALMTKAMLVFGAPGTFLSFPALEPLSYPPDQLDFTQLANRSTPVYPEFCRLVDTIPRDVLYTAASGTPFSAEYGKVLQQAQTAQSMLTSQETAALQQALAFLYVQQPDGTRADSSALVAYYQYQQAYFTAMQAYVSQKSTAGASTDPAVQAQWQNVDEPRLRAAVQAAQDAWVTNGDKAQVEQAQAVQEACAAKSPVLQWQAWRDAFSPDLDELTAPDGSSYTLAAYSPFDILTQADWPTFTLSGAEIAQLASQAPAELKNIFQPEAGAPSVSSLSFEFCSVTVNRSWCHPEVFGARFWRLSDPSELLSDGATPPQGECPGYITGLVFARNIVVTDTGGTGTPLPPRPLKVFPPILLRPGTVVPTRPPIMVKPPTVIPDPVGPVRVPAGPVAEALAPVATGTATGTIAAPRPPVLDPAPRPPVADEAPVISPVTFDRLNLGTFKTVPIGPVQSPPAPSNTEPPPAPGGGQPASGTVSILAFICTQLSRCPDPDPTLTW
jgi:hypothetical protein